MPSTRLPKDSGSKQVIFWSHSLENVSKSPLVSADNSCSVTLMISCSFVIRSIFVSSSSIVMLLLSVDSLVSFLLVLLPALLFIVERALIEVKINGQKKKKTKQKLELKLKFLKYKLVF